MGEIKKRVETYEVDMLCPECGVGIMRPSGNMVLMTSPPQYPHQCSACGHVETFTECYPRIEYKVVGEDAGKGV